MSCHEHLPAARVPAARVEAGALADESGPWVTCSGSEATTSVRPIAMRRPSKCAQSGGGPPYLVRWDGQVGLMFPESDAEIVFVARERKET
jgi:hypothetical protein